MGTSDFKPKFRKRGALWICRMITRRYSRVPEDMVFVFTERQFNTMIRNYTLGNCVITEKGMWKYSDAHALLN